uniref:hypothetical protein n=1 Tax=Sphingomonas sp. TaxID=28214 RepID=UPI0025E420F5|nr:hypothetical protein [Sphingomonas sp.]
MRIATQVISSRYGDAAVVVAAPVVVVILTPIADIVAVAPIAGCTRHLAIIAAAIAAPLAGVATTTIRAIAAVLIGIELSLRLCLGLGLGLWLLRLGARGVEIVARIV